MLNNNTILSFILPCYNVEKFIGACLDSLLSQDIPQEEYEIICVNDCSTDATAKIISEYQKEHENINLIDLKYKTSSGEARNIGLDKASGEYVWFVDADDMIKQNVLGYLLKICEKDNLDELLFNHERVKQNGEYIEKDTTFQSSSVYSGLEYVNKFFPNNLSKLSIVWNHIYRNDYLADNNFRSPEINMGEDGPFAWRTLLFAKNVKSIEDSYYIYRCNNYSMTAEFQTKPTPEKLFEKSFLFGKEVKMLAADVEKSDKKIAEELNSIARWSVNSFTEILIKKYDRLDAEEFYKIAISHISVVDIMLRYLNKRNEGFANSLQKGRLYYLMWMLREKCRYQIKLITGKK